MNAIGSAMQVEAPRMSERASRDSSGRRLNAPRRMFDGHAINPIVSRRHVRPIAFQEPRVERSIASDAWVADRPILDIEERPLWVAASEVVPLGDLTAANR